DVDGVAVENPGEAGRDDAGRAAGLDGHGGVLPGGAAAEVPAADDDVAGLDRGGVACVNVLHAVLGQLLGRGGVQVPGGDDDVGIHIVAVFKNSSTGHGYSPFSSLAGSLRQPATADAAATAGLARTTSLLTWPMRPTKLRLVVVTARSPSHMTPIWPPRQGPQVGVETAQPDSMKIFKRP